MTITPHLLGSSYHDVVAWRRAYIEHHAHVGALQYAVDWTVITVALGYLGLRDVAGWARFAGVRR